MLTGLAAGLGTACAPRSPVALAPTPEPVGRARLGWRWVPGTTMSWTTRVERRVGRVTSTRVTTWAYTALSLPPDGVVRLEGHLRAFGATVLVDGVPLPDDRVAPAADAVRRGAREHIRLALRLSGRLLDVPDDDLDELLPHRMLGLHLPTEPVDVGAAWSDPALVLPFAALLPATARVRATGTSRLTDLHSARSGWEAVLDQRGTVSVEGVGPRLELAGRATWATDPGRLMTRDLEVRAVPERVDSDRTDPSRAGILRITMSPADGRDRA